jgi:multidrug transporter EmrE-like cation transporter
LSAFNFLVLGTAIVIFLVAASTSRVYATDGRLIVVVIAMALYVVGNLMMIRIMREIGLGVAISVATIAQLILINVVAYAVFGERLGPLQLAGILLGVVSMALILFPAARS